MKRNERAKGNYCRQERRNERFGFDESKPSFVVRKGTNKDRKKVEGRKKDEPRVVGCASWLLYIYAWL